jgi:hypothetical protein
MRVDIKAAGKKNEQTSLGLLMLLAVPFAAGYLLASPAITSYFPIVIERALTNYRGEIDKAADSAVAMVRDALAGIGLL